MSAGFLVSRRRLVAAAAAIALLGAALGYGAGRLLESPAPAPAGREGRPILYWYDPMVPSQHFDKPGKSPFMDMQLVPKYAGETDGEAAVAIDPARVQSLGLRTAVAQFGTLESGPAVTGTIDFNQRQVAIVQARAAGFVQRVYGRAPGDVVAAGAPLTDILIPEWAGAQSEFLAVRRTGDADLTRAARQRLVLLGMPAGTIAAVERSGRSRSIVTVVTPMGGVIRTLGVRAGMSVAAGQTLAELNGLETVWLNAAVPEAMAGRLRPGQPVSATLAAFPGEAFFGTIAAVLPAVEPESRTLTVRIALPNRGGQLRPGMFATVDFGGSGRTALLVPSEAVIRTGRRTLVMLALPHGRYQPAEVRIGAEAGGRTEVLAGLAAGEKIVSSGQFLLDSEASLSGIRARPIAGANAGDAARTPIKAASYEATGRIDRISALDVTITHGPVPAIDWPAMTMTFRLATPRLAQGFKAGDQVRFRFEQAPAGPMVRTMAHEQHR